MVPKLRLIYLDIGGRGDFVRHTLAAGGIDFEDVRLTREELTKRKSEFTFGSVPILQVEGEILAESNALMRYAGKLAGLYPEDPKDACKVDMIVDALDTSLASVLSENTVENCSKLVETDVPRYYGAMNKIFAQSDGPFLLGDRMTIADIKLSTVLTFITSGYFENVPKDLLDKYENLMSSKNAVLANEKILEWNEAHK